MISSRVASNVAGWSLLRGPSRAGAGAARLSFTAVGGPVASCPLEEDLRVSRGPAPRQDVRPFEDIPGPRSLPLVGTLYHYLPFVGQFCTPKF